ncbi:MAG: hypothetical protein QOE91_1011 [Gaiellaceae bacterium]|nr:hypothetical protein [Gaiellaceae bacterium]
MLLVVLFAIGFVVALALALAFRRPRGRLGVALAGLAVWAAYTLYIETIASCPARGECDKQLGVLFLAAVAAGWLAGVAASWPLRRPVSR